MLRDHISWLALALLIHRLRHVIKRDPAARSYSDAALAPVAEQEDFDTELMQTFGAALPKPYGAPPRA